MDDRKDLTKDLFTQFFFLDLQYYDNNNFASFR